MKAQFFVLAVTLLSAAPAAASPTSQQQEARQMAGRAAAYAYQRRPEKADALKPPMNISGGVGVHSGGSRWNWDGWTGGKAKKGWVQKSTDLGNGVREVVTQRKTLSRNSSSVEHNRTVTLADGTERITHTTDTTNGRTWWRWRANTVAKTLVIDNRTDGSQTSSEATAKHVGERVKVKAVAQIVPAAQNGGEGAIARVSAKGR